MIENFVIGTINPVNMVKRVEVNFSCQLVDLSDLSDICSPAVAGRIDDDFDSNFNFMIRTKNNQKLFGYVSMILTYAIE